MRCDSHAYWYAPFFGELKLDVLATYSEDAPTRQSVHQYAHETGDYQKLKIQPVPGLRVTKVFDRVGDRDADNQDPELLQYGSYPGRAQAFCDTFVQPPVVCHSLDETAADVDAAFISDSSSPKDGEDHLALARPFLERGIPCFVDKPFAASLADARAMVRLAIDNNTALTHASLLSRTQTGMTFRRRFDEVVEAGLLVVKGVGFANGAVCHGVALAHSLFGYGVEAVDYMGARAGEAEHWNRVSSKYYLEYMLCYYGDGRQAIVLNANQDVYPRTSEFFASAYGKGGAVHSRGIGDREFISAGAPIVNLFKQMIETGEPPIPYEHILESIAVVDAARLAQAERRRVEVSEIWDRTAQKE